MNKYAAIKRISYSVNTDYYALSYVLILTLNEYKCTGKNKSFKDFRKIAFITNLLMSNQRFNEMSLASLKRAYYESKISLDPLSKLMFILENKGVIKVKDSDEEIKSFWLNKKAIPKNFINNALFESEKSFIKSLKEEHPRANSLSFKSFLDRVFKDKGVDIWES